MYVCRACGKENLVDRRFCHWCETPMLTSSVTGRLSSHMLLHSGRYSIIGLLGQGGMGAVYKAQDNLHQRLVAVKEMSQNGLYGQELQEAIMAFTREAELLARLDHRSLPRIYQQFEENGRRYLVMDFIQGATLEHYWRTRQQEGKQIPIKSILNIGMQLCSVLDYLHTQQPPIIFRDLKPANSMLTPQGQVYLIDFGIARLFKPGTEKDTVALGSPGYAPPEQYGKATSPQSDIYSLGAVLHQLLTGDDPSQTPFRFKPFSTTTPLLEDLIMSMVAADEIQRPATMKSVLKMLQGIAKELPQSKIGMTDSHATRTASIVSGIRPVNVYALLSPATQDQHLWKALRSQLEVFIDAIPNVRIHQGDIFSQQDASAHSNASASSDLILLLLSEDFLVSSACMANMKRAIDHAGRRGVKTLSLLLRPCSWQKTSLARVPLLMPDALMHLSPYAQEQRIVEAAKSMRAQIAALVLKEKQEGSMNLLQWLLWQLYRNDGINCPYFVVGQYALKYIRHSGHAGVFFHLLDLRTGRAIANYTIESHNSTRITDLLRIIAPSCIIPRDVQGVAMYERPLQLEMR